MRSLLKMIKHRLAIGVFFICMNRRCLRQRQEPQKSSGKSWNGNNEQVHLVLAMGGREGRQGGEGKMCQGRRHPPKVSGRVRDKWQTHRKQGLECGQLRQGQPRTKPEGK